MSQKFSESDIGAAFDFKPDESRAFLCPKILTVLRESTGGPPQFEFAFVV